MRKYIPQKRLLFFKLWTRFISDLKNGNRKRFATARSYSKEFPFYIETNQTIRQTPSTENKIHNLKIASQKIERVIIHPNEIFSFWHIINNPSSGNGYKKGRNLISGKIKEDYGGGLCQLSGIIYHTSLKAGLEILERHNHSVDIYQEHERFTPLGADATIVYGYKDLRIINNTSHAIAFRFQITSDQLTCRLLSSAKLEEHNLIFSKEYMENKVIVYTKKSTDNKEEVVKVSEYKTLL